MKVCHITTVHSRNDVRIFYKECMSLSNNGYDVSLIVADGLGNDIVNGVCIYDIGKEKNRFFRILRNSIKANIKAKEVNAEIYHVHDPELLLIVGGLRKITKKIIYDVHEDVPRQILNKYYLPKILRNIISRIFETFENIKSKKINTIITSTEHIRNRFLKLNLNTQAINNYPLLNEDILFNNEWNKKNKSIAYIGGIFRTRGIVQILESIKDTDIKLLLAGIFSPPELEYECKNHKGWDNVVYYGFIKREEINIFFKEVSAGIVILENTPSYIYSMPVKMFEYMASGIPVVASNFPLWKEIVELNNCGICVDPTNVKEIKESLLFLFNNKELCEKMGNNGRKAIEQKYNWNIEEIKLLEIYNSLA
jgi:glycosyltransferase involved in cell wall biosynthesis